MSYPMSPPPPAQPPQQFAPPPPQPAQSPMQNQIVQPYSQTASPIPPSPYTAPPPAKRQKLSPDPRSPMAAMPQYPQTPQAAPASGTYGNPYAQPGHQQPYNNNAYPSPSPQGGFNTPQPYQQPQSPWPAHQQAAPSPSRGTGAASPPTVSQMMPPPPRPIKEEREEKVGVDDINDSLFGSGISLKDEENYFHSMWNNRPAQGSFATDRSKSFASTTLSPERSFNLLQSGSSFGDQGSGAFAGTLGQPLTQEEIENAQKRKREAAARAKAERDQHHLNNPFLLGNILRKKIQNQAYEAGVKVEMHGVYERAEPPKVMVNKAATNGVAALTTTSVQDAAPSKVDVGVPFEQLLSLLSLASGERIRGLVDDAYGLARVRRYGDHGRVVPPEFADLATGAGKQTEVSIPSENISGSSWEQPMEPDPTTEEAGATKSSRQTNTISFQGTLNAHLRHLAERDHLAEKERLKKREARKRTGELSTGGADDASTTDASAAADTTTDPAAPKMTKKELNKKAKENATATEAQAINSANTTAAMAFMGKKKNKYGWMTGGMGSVQGNRYAKPGSGGGAAGGSGGGVKSETATPPASSTSTTAANEAITAKSDSVQATVAAAAAEKKPSAHAWGDWREDGVDGKGIQLRDWVHVLERDGRERKALLKAGLKLR